MSMNQCGRALVMTTARRWSNRSFWLAGAVLGSLALCWALNSGHSPGPFQPRSRPSVATVEVDQGDVALVVTETRHSRKLRR